MIDTRFLQTIAGWQRDLWAQEALFGDEDSRKIDAARRGVRRDHRVVAYCVYENPFGKAGGIFAVAANLPQHLRSVCRDVVVVSPFHSALRTADRRSLRPLSKVNVPYGSQQIPTDIYEHQRGGVRWLLFEADGFFDAYGGVMRDNPYDHGGCPGTSVDSNERLRRDGLFASAAIPVILKAVGLERDLIVHLQDWQLAATVLTMKQAILAGSIKTAAVLLTMHNPYDCYLPQDQLAWITGLTGVERWHREPEAAAAEAAAEPATAAEAWGGEAATMGLRARDTAYECMLPLVDGPISTVSRGFAAELTTAPLQTVHFVNHLQTIFRRHGLVGVDNGLFMPPRLSYSPDATQQARRGAVDAILQEKLQKRAKMLEVLSRYRPAQAIGWLSVQGDWDLTRLPDDVPVFMMFGRMDPGQKGFDLLLRAIRRIPPNAAKFVISPIVPAGFEPYRKDLHDLAMSRPGDVVVFPFAMREGYLETMAGASYCVMPSFHEPFGAATEPFLKGTPVVAHATGGLRQQVVDFDDGHGVGTGLLFHRPQTTTAMEAGRQWSGIMNASQPQDRVRYPIYVSLVNGLADALQRAIAIYTQNPKGYGRMLAELHDQALRFAWTRSASEYGLLYDLAIRD